MSRIATDNPGLPVTMLFLEVLIGALLFATLFRCVDPNGREGQPSLPERAPAPPLHRLSEHACHFRVALRPCAPVYPLYRTWHLICDLFRILDYAQRCVETLPGLVSIPSGDPPSCALCAQGARGIALLSRRFFCALSAGPRDCMSGNGGVCSQNAADSRTIIQNDLGVSRGALLCGHIYLFRVTLTLVLCRFRLVHVPCSAFLNFYKSPAGSFDWSAVPPIIKGFCQEYAETVGATAGSVLFALLPLACTLACRANVCPSKLTMKEPLILFSVITAASGTCKASTLGQVLLAKPLLPAHPLTSPCAHSRCSAS